MRRIQFAALFLEAVLRCSSASAQDGGLRYNLTDLQAYMTGTSITSSVAFAINPNGLVTGDYVDGSSQYCFIYYPPTRLRRSGQVVSFSSLAPFWCDARAVDSWGDVAGSMHMSNGLVNAFLRQTNGTITTFPSLYGFNSFGFGVDDYKEVVGEMDQYVDPSTYTYATRWSPNGTAVNLNPFPVSDDYSQALSTNPSGSAVVVNVSNWYPYIWPSSLANQPYCANGPELGEIPVYGSAVNANGHEVGKMWCFDGSHAVLWANGAFTDLGFPDSRASAISSDDWIVGWSAAFSGGAPTLRVSDPSCPLMVNLNSLLDSTGAGWTVVYAYGINTAHQIVGQAKDSAGKLHAVLLTPDNNLPLCHSN